MIPERNLNMHEMRSYVREEEEEEEERVKRTVKIINIIVIRIQFKSLIFEN